jgi:hypothetical protein
MGVVVVDFRVKNSVMDFMGFTGAFFDDFAITSRAEARRASSEGRWR